MAQQSNDKRMKNVVRQNNSGNQYENDKMASANKNMKRNQSMKVVMTNNK